MNYILEGQREYEEKERLLEVAKANKIRIKAELHLLKEGDCGQQVKEALRLYKEKKELKKVIEEAKRENNHAAMNHQMEAALIRQRHAAEFAPPPANGGRRSRSRTYKRNRRSKKSRKC